MTKLILKLLLSAMVVSLGALFAPVEGQNNIRTEAATVQTIIIKSVTQIHYEPIAEIKIESIKNNYDLAPQKHQTAVKIGGLIIIILFIAFTYFYCTRNTVSIVKLTIETPKASTANMNITIKNYT